MRRGKVKVASKLIGEIRSQFSLAVPEQGASATRLASWHLLTVVGFPVAIIHGSVDRLYVGLAAVV